MLDQVFRAKNPGDIVREPLAIQARSIQQIATALEGLGATHVLAPFATSLRERSAAVSEAVARLNAAVLARATAEGDEENAQDALRRAYESNYFDARRQFGRSIAERLFPKLRRRGSTEEATDPSGGGGPTS